MAAANFPPAPTYAEPVVLDENTRKSQFNPIWLKWFLDVTAFISANGGGGGGASAHNLLSGLQGGTSGEYYHLTLAEHAELVANLFGVQTVAVDTTLTTTYPTTVVTATGKTMTLPGAAAGLVGRTWTVVLGTNGYTTVSRSGSDTIILPDSSTSIRLDNKGSSVSLRCLTTSSWGVV